MAPLSQPRPVAALALALVVALAWAAPAMANKSAEAEAAFALGKDEEAIRLFTDAIMESAGDLKALAAAHFGRGEVEAMYRKPDAAIADFTAALMFETDTASRANIFWSRAEVYVRRRMNTEALADYGESLKLVPGALGVRLSRAALYGRMKMKDEAVADYDAALKINPKSARALVNRAVLLDLPIPKTSMRAE